MLSTHGTDHAIDAVCPINWQHPLNRGLVGWWLTPWGWSGGSKLPDLTRANPGTLTNGPTWTAGPNGFGAINLGGSPQFVNVAHSAALNLSGDFSVSGWLKKPDGMGTAGVLDKRRGDESTPAWSVHLSNATSSMRFQPNLGGANVTIDSADISTILTNWFHWCITRSGSAFQWYANGRVSGSGATNAGAMATNTADATFGKLSGDIFYLTGYQTDVRIQDAALSAAEVAAFYDQSLRAYPDLLRRVSSKVYSYVAPAGGRVTKNTRAFPLGVEVGMNHLMPL